MANLNLSQFTEKLFVADADHTFIWDTAASISKRVSRNSWLSGTTANCRLGLADAATPVAQTLSVQSVVAGTTNTAGAAFTIDGSQGTGTGAGGALIFRTAAAGSSGSTQNALGTAMLITADKRVVPTGLTIDGSGLFDIFNDLASAQGRTFPARSASFGRLGICYRADAQIAWSPGNGSSVDGGNMGTADTILLRDGAANTLALRNGAGVPQAFRVYNTYLGTTANEWFEIDWKTTAGLLKIGTASGGTGVGRPIELNASGSYINFNIGTIVKFAVASTSNLSYQDFKFNSHNSHDIGASGANSPRNVYVGTSLFTGVGGINFDINARLRSPATDVITLYNNGLSDFNRLQFGGTTNLFPAIKRSSTTLQARLADDSAFAPIQGKLTTDTAYTATVVAATGYITIYDSTGAAYRVPCAV